MASRSHKSQNYDSKDNVRAGYLALKSGDWIEARRKFEAALAGKVTADALEGLGRAAWWLDDLKVVFRVRLAGLRRRQGRFDEADSLLQQADGHRLALLEQAALALDSGNSQGALQMAERFLRRVRDDNKADRLAGFEIALRAYIALGNRKQAAATLSELRTGSHKAGAVAAVAPLADGLIAFANGDCETARRSLEDAVDIFNQHGAIFDAARPRAELARVLHSDGQKDAAFNEARAALAIFEELGAENEARQVERFLSDLTEQGDKQKINFPDGLIPREVEILRLVAHGHSNRDTAERLHISEFTVKRHVQNILTKLDLPTRAAASAYAARKGLL